MTDEGAAILRALGAVIKSQRDADPRRLDQADAARFLQVVNKVETPQVVNNIEPTHVPVQVVVDMTPVAAALDRMAESQKEQSALFARLLDVLAARPAIEFNPVVNVPEQKPHTVNVNVPKQEPPSVTVNVPEQKPPTIKVQVPEQEPPVVNVHVSPAKSGRVTFEPSYDDKGKLIGLSRNSED